MDHLAQGSGGNRYDAQR